MNGKELSEKFGCMVFGDKAMKERLDEKSYADVKKAIASGEQLSHELAKKIADAMKEWAIEKGATHFTHWFQPMTGITAEKHEGFAEPDENGEIIMKFSERSLIKGESDASSLPSGGLRATFEARGYTAWDPTSYAFVKDGTLYIPTAFCSYDGSALDKKTPLLRSMEALSKQAVRVLKVFGNDKVKKVVPCVGAEQEYFLIDKSVYEKRQDLIHCGRTLFGARPAKGQELEDHYYGAIKSRVAEFMKDVDEELWKLGVYAKTEHNEVAPSQHELACVFAQANIATDQNQLAMETLKSVANRHGLVCLLHEKPFETVNGSGKHDNWSLCTDYGENLLDPGDTPEKNTQFLLFLLAVIKGVDEYQDLLRISVATAANDHRLGGNEAPPAIISVYIGQDLEDVLDSVEQGKEYVAKGKTQLKTGVSALLPIQKDSTDRNRTSPFAFTGNKFEFRMVGSSENIACPNFILNTIVAEELCGFADRLEKATDLNAELKELFKDTIKEHRRIVFSGNNYSEEWAKEAAKRKLYNLKTTVDALPHYKDEKNVGLFGKHGVLSESEINSRLDILLDNYANIVHIEALTAFDMARQEILPAVVGYEGFLAKTLNEKRASGIKNVLLEKKTLSEIAAIADKFSDKLDALEKGLDGFPKTGDAFKRATYCKDVLLTAMRELRNFADGLELLIGKKFYPFPNYADILYSVKY